VAKLSGKRKEEIMSHDTPKLIQCGDHSFAPWAITCVHICDNTAADVVRVPQPEGSEVEADWLCTECFERHFGEGEKKGDITDLRAVCIHCLRKALKPYQDKMTHTQ
jgi:hypothetical protein